MYLQGPCILRPCISRSYCSWRSAAWCSLNFQSRFKMTNSLLLIFVVQAFLLTYLQTNMQVIDLRALKRSLANSLCEQKKQMAAECDQFCAQILKRFLFIKSASEQIFAHKSSFLIYFEIHNLEK